MAAQIKILAKRKVHENFKVKIDTRNLIGDITIAQQSFAPKSTQYYYPVVDVSQRFEESLANCRRKRKNRCVGANENVSTSNRHPNKIKDNPSETIGNKRTTRPRYNSETMEMYSVTNPRRASELVDQLLLDIYGRTDYICAETGRIFETEYGSSTSIRSVCEKFDEKMQYSRLILKNDVELQMLIGALQERVSYSGSLLVKQLKRRDALKSKEEKLCNVITAHLQACSRKRSEDTNMRFTPTPVPGDSGFNQWRDAMKMVAKLPGGIPSEFRRKLWLELSEKYLQSKGVNWSQTERLCFNEWSNPDDNELGVQIVKDLHRTGCSLFCGAAGQENQALLKRVLLAYARWNKSVGYCQGFNMLAALILQVMDKSEADSVKVMIYLIEGVLPESYFANNLRGLSVDMVVFRDLLKMRLPLLSKHLEALQNDAREGNSYEPPLTNVFTMQWFLTLFCNCLPQSTVLRVWDLIFLEGNEILLRTAIAIWEKLSDRILAVNSADEFYSIMGVLTREMLEFGLVDSNTLVKSIVAIGACPELNEMRDRYLYNITPWTQSVQTAAKKGLKLFYSDDDDVESDDEKAAVTAAYGMTAGRKRERNMSATGANLIQPYAHGHPDRERLALDISALKKQYTRLRERQRQAHIILQAACARQPIGPNPTPPPIAMNHLLLGKNAIVNSRGRRLGPPKGAIPPARKIEPIKKNSQGETVHWKDTAKIRYPRRPSYIEEPIEKKETFAPDSDSSSYSDDDGSSTSTELCDEPDRLDDFDSDDKSADAAKPIDKKARASSNEIKNNRNRNKTTLEQDAINESETNVGELKIGVDSGVKLTESEEKVISDKSNFEVVNENVFVKIDNQTEELLDFEANILDNKDTLHSQYSTHISDNNEATNDQIVQSQNGTQIEITTVNDLEIKCTDNLSRDSSQNVNEIKFIKNTLITSNKNEEGTVSEEIKNIPKNIKTPDDTSNKCEDTGSEINKSESQHFFTFENSSSSQTNLEESPVSSYNFKDNWSNSKENIDDSSLIVENTSSMRTLHFSDQASSFEDNPLSFEESQEKLKSYDQPNLLSFEDHIEEKSKIITPDKSYSSELMHNFEEDKHKQLNSEKKLNDSNGVQDKEDVTELKTDVKVDESINQILEDKSCDFDSFLEERLDNQTTEDLSCDFESFLEERLSNQKSEDKSGDFDSFLEERVNILKQNTTPAPQEENKFTWQLNEEKLRRHKSYEETVKSDLDKSFIYKQRSFDIHASPDEETVQWTPFQSRTTAEDNETKNETILISLSSERKTQEFPNLIFEEDLKKDANMSISPQNEDRIQCQSNIENVVNESTGYISQNKQDINTNRSENKSMENSNTVRENSKEEKYNHKIKSKEIDSKPTSNQIEATLIKSLQVTHSSTKKEEIKYDESPVEKHDTPSSFDKNKKTIISLPKTQPFAKEVIKAEQEQLKDEICLITLTSESPDTEDTQIKIDVKFFEDTKEICKESLVKQPSIELLTVEDKRLEAGRRNSERALKIIQENSMILHRILQQQRSSEIEDSEEELSKSPISKTFLRSESLLCDDRSSRDEDEDLSATESYSISPAILDEDLDKSPKRNTDMVESPEKHTSLSEELSNETVLPFLNEACTTSTLGESNNTKQNTEKALYEEISCQIRHEADLRSSHIEENISPKKDIYKAAKSEKLDYLTEESSKENEVYPKTLIICEENKSESLKGDIHIDKSLEPVTSSGKLSKDNDLKIKHNILRISEEDKIKSSKNDIDKADSTASSKETLKENIQMTETPSITKEDNQKSERKIVQPENTAELSTASENEFQSTNKKYSTLDENLGLSLNIDKYESDEITKENEYKLKIGKTTEDFLYTSKSPKRNIDGSAEESESQFQKITIMEKSKPTNEDDFLYTRKSPIRNIYESKEQKTEIQKKTKSENDFLRRLRSPEKNKYENDDVQSKENESHLGKTTNSTENKLITKDNDNDVVYRSKSPKKDKYESEPQSKELQTLSNSEENKLKKKDSGRDYLYKRKYETMRNPFSPEDEPDKTSTSIYSSPTKYSTKDRHSISPENEAGKVSPYSSPSKYPRTEDDTSERSSYSSPSKYLSSAEERKDSLSSYGRYQSFQEDEPVSSFQRSKEYKKRATSFDSNELELDRYSPSKFRNRYTSLGSPLEEDSNEFSERASDRKDNIKEEEKIKFSHFRSKSPEGSTKETYDSPGRHLDESSDDFKFNTNFRTETSRYTSPGRSLEQSQLQSLEKSPKYVSKDDKEIYESPRRQLKDTTDDKQRYYSERPSSPGRSTEATYSVDKSPTHLNKEEISKYESPRRQFENTLREEQLSEHSAKYESPRRYFEDNSKQDDKQKAHSPKRVTKEDDTIYESPRRKFEDTYKENNDRSSERQFRSTNKDLSEKYKLPEFEEPSKCIKKELEDDTKYESPRRKFEEAYKADTRVDRFKTANEEIDDKYRCSSIESSTKHVDEINASVKKLEEKSLREGAVKYKSPRRKFEDAYQEDARSDLSLEKRITSTKDYINSEFKESTKYVNQISSSERKLDEGSPKKDSSSKYLASDRLRNEDDNNTTSTDKKSSAQSYYEYPENSSDYQKLNKSNLSIDLASSQFSSSYSPEVSPPKHLSCLQFASFQTDIPCTSKTLQISPICSKEKSTSPTDSKYLPSFSLPTLSPPRRTIKSPLSPDKTFSPFPVQPTTRQPKEVGIRLGLYKDLSPLKSPAK